jgi:hypothetical protein
MYVVHDNPFRLVSKCKDYPAVTGLSMEKAAENGAL